MPRATRNTNTNSGKRGIGRPVEAEDVLEQQRRDAQRRAEGQHHRAIRISGAISARSRIIRISSTTTRTTGMITLLSRLDGDLDVEVDRRPAADQRVGARRRRGPRPGRPRRCRRPPARRRPRRSVAWMKRDAVAVGRSGSDGARVPGDPDASPSRDRGGLVGVGDDLDRCWSCRPGRARRASSGPRWSRTPWCSCPRSERPSASSRTRPRQATPSSERWSRPRPCAGAGRCGDRRGPRSRSAVGSASRTSGRLGQKIQRPQMTSSAGSSVTITSSVTRDADGARPGRGRPWSSSRRAAGTACRATTVAALAKIAGAARCRAKAIASCRSSWRRSSSR